MCFGGDDAPQAPQIAAPPKPEEMVDFFNYLAGVKYITSTDSKGKKRAEVVRLPRSPEEQAFFSELESGLRQSIGNIKAMIQRNPQAVVHYMPFINTLGRLNQETVNDLQQIAGLEGVENDVRHFRDISTQYLNERFDAQSRALEDSLAHRGLSNSAQGDKERRELAQRMDKAVIDNDWNALQYGEDLAGKKFGNRMAGFNARQIGRQAQAGAAEIEYNAGRQYYADNEAERAARIREQEGLADKQNALIVQDYNKAMGGNVEQNALGRYSAENQVQVQHYNADVDRIYKNYNMQLGEYNANNQPGFLHQALNIGGIMGAAYLGGGGSLTSALGMGGGGIAGNMLANARKVLR